MWRSLSLLGKILSFRGVLFTFPPGASVVVLKKRKVLAVLFLPNPLLTDIPPAIYLTSTIKSARSHDWKKVACIKNFWELPEEGRPFPSECLMLATHEPCSMCVSAITWSAFKVSK